MSLALIALVSLLVGMAACCIADFRSRTIPNGIIVAMLAAAFALQAIGRGTSGIGIAIAGMLAASVPLLPAFALGGIGGGDVKMMAAIGAFLGPKLALVALVAGMVAGGIVMVIELARRGRLSEKTRETFRRTRESVTTRSTSPLRLDDSDPETISLPYSFPLAFGTLLVLVFAL